MGTRREPVSVVAKSVSAGRTCTLPVTRNDVALPGSAVAVDDAASRVKNLVGRSVAWPSTSNDGEGSDASDSSRPLAPTSTEKRGDSNAALSPPCELFTADGEV